MMSVAKKPKTCRLACSASPSTGTAGAPVWSAASIQIPSGTPAVRAAPKARSAKGR